MGAIFTSLERTLAAGVVLLIIIVLLVGAATGQMTKIDHAWATPDVQYFVSKVGCGIAGFEEEDIAVLFCDAPSNCIKNIRAKPGPRDAITRIPNGMCSCSNRNPSA